MKALILAAGFGTRLLPYTKINPKPLFPFCSVPLLKRHITALINSGCSEIYINTHYLAEKIQNFIQNENFKIPVNIIHEKEILETGGAVKNICSIIKNEPFIAVNADIYTNVSFKKIYDFHMKNKNKATLCICKNRFNNISCSKNMITGFNQNFHKDLFTFTGIQVIDPSLENFFEYKESSITAYKKMIESNIKISPYFLLDNEEFEDLGTIESFKKKTIEYLIEKNSLLNKNFKTIKIAGDGSDRQWFRLSDNNKSVIMADHQNIDFKGDPQTKSYVKIGNHLFNQNICVPKILAHDFFTGIVITQDLGDIRLEDFIKNKSLKEQFEIFKNIIDNLYNFAFTGIKDFNDNMTYQTKMYDKKMSETECMYFKNEFLINFLNLKDLNNLKLEKAFELISEKASRPDNTVLMHRDFQSRNIMMKNEKPYFIDFQGARKGPVQYDAASFIIDPYMNLDENIKSDLVEYCAVLAKEKGMDKKQFLDQYYFCAVSRNLHILGAFSFLSLKKQKIYFKSYIPAAINSLKKSLNHIENKDICYLKEIVSQIKGDEIG